MIKTLNVHGLRLVFDIGAYDGGGIQPIVAQDVARVVCVEPNINSFAKLHIRFSTNEDIEVVNKLVLDDSRSNGEVYISRAHPNISTASKKFITDSRYANDKDENNVPFEWGLTSQVDITTLSDLIAEYGTPDFIKVSTTGTEHTVLRGLNHLLKGTLICFDIYEELITLSKETILHLNELGYNQFGIIEGQNIMHYPSTYHSYEVFTERLDKAFPSLNKNFLGRIYTKYEDT